ncbi:hypothetical protein H4Q26_008497 [Puccinia striiformis f. sp. tritici PST-130]|nr:hypothetical protein H4Q26_008497 [Puccinia striiformis f. sp. tritici PST-130]
MQFINLSIFAILAAFSAATPTANSVHQLERRQNCGNILPACSEAQSSAKLIVAARDRSRDVTCGLAQVLAPALWFADNKAAAVSSSNCTRTYDIMERARTRSWIYFSDLLR